jgi:hypothetical protein
MSKLPADSTAAARSRREKFGTFCFKSSLKKLAPPHMAPKRGVPPQSGCHTVDMTDIGQETRRVEVRFGSLVDIAAALPNVRFTPECVAKLKNC